MIKTYKSNTNISINVVLPNKKNLHITFTPLSNGSSTFSTDQEEVIKAIESHYNFGSLFRLHSTIEVTEINLKNEHIADANTENPIIANDEDVIDEDIQSGLKQVSVSDLASAKDYLADKFGISRTLLRSQKAIMEQAYANGIEFVGLS